ncbi:metalloregulator ArsR/SmtB family transcription factor [Streptomyces sp. NPDC046685]|uniref:ArsR/SmtB family transcription factor n=1 Tax=Streptomyces sp. NPDC046685 TaxID=3157202 RepID=UPI0033E377CA
MDTQVSLSGDAGVDQAVAVLKAVADPTRYRLLWALCRREMAVSEMAELVGAHVAAVSQHLARLRGAGLVVTRREGTRIFYRVAGGHVRPLLEETWLAARESVGEGAQTPGDEDAARRDVAAAPVAVRARAMRPAPGV